MYQLYCFKTISRAERVAWTLNELDQKYERIELDAKTDEHRADEYLKINPYGKVPVLYDGKNWQMESAAICTSLAEKHFKEGFIPEPGTPERAEYYQWIFFCMSELEAEIWALHKQLMIYPKEKKSAKAAKLARENYLQALSILSNHMKTREYLVGNGFSVADIILGFNLVWADKYKLLEQDTMLLEYLKRIKGRPHCPSIMQQEP